MPWLSGLAPPRAARAQRGRGLGNVLVLLVAATGRDGIGGASVLASAELGAADTPWGDAQPAEHDGSEHPGGDAADKRPTVQVGDPFEEKKLLECSLELLERGLLCSLQNLGAAGLSSSASEMASKGGVGSDIDVAKVPLREPGIEPFEVMVSESQQRMLAWWRRRTWRRCSALCAKWEVNGTAIGAVTDSGRIRVLSAGAWWGTCRWRRWWTDARCMTSHRASPPGQIYFGAAGHARARRRSAGDLARAAGLGQRRLAQAAVRAL